MTTTNETTSHTDDRIAKRLHEAGDRLVEIKEDLASNVGTRIASLGALMKKHPFAALGIGFGLGYLIARVLHR
jgi:ElaB/YqjD/DUF883 family membrane-anchored ribosome-binding protein